MKLPPLRGYKKLAKSFSGRAYDEHGWGPAWLGYFFVSMAETSGNRLERLETWSPTEVLLLSIAVGLSFGAAAQAAGVGGLWLHLGAKMVGGKEGFFETVKAAGYAVFWPGLLIFPAVVVENYTFREAEGAGAVPLLIALVWHAVVGVWGWLRSVNAVRVLHDRSVWQAVVIALWLPVVAVAVVAVFLL